MLTTVVRAAPLMEDGPPKVLEAVPAVYPAKLKEQRITGWARIALTIDERGKVAKAEVAEETLSEFGQAALDAVRRFKFQPAYSAGHPRAMSVILPLNFDFDGADLAELEAHRQREVLPSGPPTVEISAVSDWPELKKEVRPSTPMILEAKGWMGEATVGFVVDERGIPRDVHLIKSTERKCGARAMDAVRQWRFSPGRLNGQVVRVALEVPIVFFPESTELNGARVKPGVNRRIDPTLIDAVELGAGAVTALPPMPLNFVSPAYPEEMRSRNVEGNVTVEAIIDVHGRITHVFTTYAESAFFGALAERALSYSTFTAATRDGVPVECHITQPMGFILRDASTPADGGHSPSK